MDTLLLETSYPQNKMIFDYLSKIDQLRETLKKKNLNREEREIFYDIIGIIKDLEHTSRNVDSEPLERCHKTPKTLVLRIQWYHHTYYDIFMIWKEMQHDILKIKYINKDFKETLDECLRVLEELEAVL